MDNAIDFLTAISQYDRSRSVNQSRFKLPNVSNSQADKNTEKEMFLNFCIALEQSIMITLFKGTIKPLHYAKEMQNAVFPSQCEQSKA